MAFFGQIGHVLTNTGTPARWSDGWICISVTSGPNSNNYLYRIQNHTDPSNSGNRNIEYDTNLNIWDANPSTGGNQDPAQFMDSTLSNVITPTNTHTTLYLTDASNALNAELSVNYSTGGGSSSGGTGTEGTSSGGSGVPASLGTTRVSSNFW